MKMQSAIGLFKPENEAIFIDAFTVNGSKFYFYAFPPFSLILKALAMIQRDKAEGIIVLPYWRNEPWFPLFKKLRIKKNELFLSQTVICYYLPVDCFSIPERGTCL